jgi:asparagine synthase (glutamine-hydrolysing)
LIVLSGVIGWTGHRLVEHCRNSLSAQRVFGRASEPIDLGWAAIGYASDRPYDPIAQNGPFSIVADARIDNREELKSRFALPRATSDAQIIAAAWERFGADTPTHLSGAFAFAVLDSSERTVHLVRDQVGAKPLLLAERDGLLGFSSMASGVIALTDHRPDLELLAQRLANLDRTEGRTAWTGVHQVATACVTSIHANSRRVIRYFRPEQLDGMPMTPDLTRRSSDLIDRSVAEAISDDERTVAAHLSSGFDSTAVATSAKRVLRDGQKLILYTSAPMIEGHLLKARGRIADESIFAARTAQTLGAEHVVVRSGGRIVDDIRGKTPFCEDVVPSPINLGWFLDIGKRAKAAGATSILTGLTGNATISFGGLIGLADYLANGRFIRWLREAILTERNNRVSWRGILFNSGRLFLPRWASDFALHKLQGQSVQVRSPFLASQAQPALSAAGSSPRPARRISAVRNEILLRSDDPIRNKAMEAMTGVEERDPCAARELIEFCYRLPAEALISGGRLKPMLTDILSERLPHAIIDPAMRGQQGTDWYDRIDREDCLGLLEDVKTSMAARELLNLDALEKSIDAWPAFDPNRRGELISYFFQVTDALATGYFLASTEKEPIGHV